MNVAEVPSLIEIQSTPAGQNGTPLWTRLSTKASCQPEKTENSRVKTILDKRVVDAFPARTIRLGAVNQNNIPNAMRLVLR
jgi:hypothetical protein